MLGFLRSFPATGLDVQTGPDPEDEKAAPNPRTRWLGGVAGALGLTGGHPLVAASQALCSRLRLATAAPRPRENCAPLTGTALKKALSELICERALIEDAYEHDRNNWQPMTFLQWQQMYMKSYCVFIFNDERMNLTLFMRHWEHIVHQSVMFDPDNFQNDLNTIVNDYGWFVEGFTMPDQSITVTFRRYNSRIMIRQPPLSLYYFAASWNKNDILKNGLLPTTSVDSVAGRRMADYDVMFKAFNLVHIRSIAKDMYDSAVGESDSGDVSTNILRLIGYMPIIVFKINTQKIAANVWSKKPPIFDEDRESGILLSYTYLPPTAFETVMHEDPVPDVFGQM